MWEWLYSFSEENICKESKNCRQYRKNDEGEEICGYCEDGYALSFNSTNCIKIENCEKLAEGDEKCKDCVEYYLPNKEGKCERTQCELYDDNDVCTKCYEGYYPDKDNNCQKISIENCIELDPSKEKCSICLGGIKADSEGKCTSSLIKGCIEYGDDGKCIECEDEDEDYDLTDDGTCKFIECKNGAKREYCGICKTGYYLEEEDDNLFCMGYDGSRDTSSDSSSRNNVEYALIIFILAFLI